MNTRTVCFSIVVLSAFACLTAAARENATHTMTGGDFGVAWLTPEGALMLSDGTNPAAAILPEMKFFKIGAGDLDGDAKTELALLDLKNKSLFVYDFQDQKLSGPYGNNVSEMTIGRFDADEKFESILACTFSGATYRWTIQIGNQGWIPLPGDFEFAAAGELNPRVSGEEAAVTCRGDLYRFDAKWQSYSQVLMGESAGMVAVGNFSATPGEEIVVACGEKGDLKLCLGRKVQPLEKQAVNLSVGKIGEKYDALVVLTPEGRLERYDAAAKTFAPLDDATDWADLLWRDTDGDGREELYALKKDAPQKLFRYNGETKHFEEK